jgi:hypothetical protein
MPSLTLNPLSAFPFELSGLPSTPPAAQRTWSPSKV